MKEYGAFVGDELARPISIAKKTGRASSASTTLLFLIPSGKQLQNIILRCCTGDGHVEQ